MRLVRRRAAGAQLLEREHQLDRVEQAGDARELRRRQAAREPDSLVPRGVDVDEQARELEVGERHRLGGDLEVEPVGDQEAVDDVEVGGGLPVHPRDDAVLDHELGLGVVRPVHRDEAELGCGVISISRRSSFAARDANRAEPSDTAEPSFPVRAPPRGRRRPCAAPPSRRAAPPTPRARPASSGPAAARCRSRAAGRRARGQLGGALEVVRELAPPVARATAAWRASVAEVARTSAATSVPARADSSVTSSSARPEGVSTRSGRRDPSG